MAKRPQIQDNEIVTTLLTAFFRSRKHAACGECPYREGHNPPVVGSNPASATEPLGCEPKIPRTYRCRPTSKNVGLFAFTDTFTSVFRGFSVSDSPRIGTALGQVPMICRQSGWILAPNSRRSRSLSGIGVIRRLRSRPEWETNTEVPIFPMRLGVGTGSLAVPSGAS